MMVHAVILLCKRIVCLVHSSGAMSVYPPSAGRPRSSGAMNVDSSANEMSDAFIIGLSDSTGMSAFDVTTISRWSESQLEDEF